MDTTILIVLLLIGVLNVSDWLIKKRRITRRDEMSDQKFLMAYRGPHGTGLDAKILEVRRQIARELALPISKIRPDDRLVELRDRYCQALVGHLALGDLFDTLLKLPGK